MPSLKGQFMRLLGDVVLHRANVVSAEDVGHGFRRILLDRDGALPRAGMKLQILLPSSDMRTYSPIAYPDGMVLLGYKQPSGPGGRWMREVQAGDEVRFVGPQRSLQVRAGPVILIGDETSVAAAASFEKERPGQVHCVFQTSAVDDVRLAAQALRLRHAHVVPIGKAQDVVDAALSVHQSVPDARLVLTGGSQLIVRVRALLRAHGVADLQTKAYWAPGRAGLD